MKIMSFNTQHCLNFIERKIDFDIMANAIRSLSPDIVGLNEMRGRGPNPDFAAQTEILAELTGMKYYYFAPALHLPAGLYGNAFLSRVPIVKSEMIMIPDAPRNPNNVNARHYETRCVLKAKLENGLTVLVTHFGLNPDEQENAVKTVLGELVSEKCILMGDFNVTPENPVLLPIRRVMKDTADAFSESKLSFPSDKPERKIDYIFISPDLDLVSADIPELIASDHRPHIAEIKL